MKLNTEIDLFQLAQDYANTRHNGHLTIMKFTGKWRACLEHLGLKTYEKIFQRW